MAAPVLQTSSPADNATEIDIEQVIQLTFSTDILAASATPATVQVFRADDDVPLRGALSVSAKKITFVPESALHQDTLYRIRVVGSSAGTGIYLRGDDGPALATTLNLTFRTRTERYVSLQEATRRTDIEREGPIRESDPLASIDSTGGLLQVQALPPTFTKIPVSATGITLDFDRLIEEVTVHSQTVVVTQKPVLGIEEYWGTTGEIGLLATTSLDPNPPPGTLETLADRVYYGIPDDRDFLANTELRVTVTTLVRGKDGTSLLEEEIYVYTTDYCPLYVSVDVMRLELGPAISVVTDDTICRLVHRRSIEAWELSNRSIPLKNPNYRIRQWVTCKVMLDLLGVLMLQRDLIAGQSKTLGDLSISQRPSDPMLGGKWSQAQKCLEELGLFASSDTLAAVAVKGAASPTARQDFRLRTWDHLLFRAEPAANLGGERYEKGRLSLAHSFGGKDVRFHHRFSLTVQSSL